MYAEGLVFYSTLFYFLLDVYPWPHCTRSGVQKISSGFCAVHRSPTRPYVRIRATTNAAASTPTRATTHSD